MNKEAGIVIDLQVPFHDVDSMRMVWHGHYYKYMELARTELFRSYEMDVETIEAMDLRMVLAESRCRHSYPLRYGDKFQVRAWFQDVDYRICIRYKIHNVTQNRRSATGRTTLVTTTPAGELLYRTPEPIAEKLRKRAS